MPDREKTLRLLNQAIDTAFGANCELVKLPVTVAIEIEELLRKQIRPSLSNTEDKDKPLLIMRHSCGAVIVYRGHDVCPHCGKKVDWDV